ncbi:hypothetical protein [Endozoicomonas sp. ONNA1]|uniref:hypothetical protein n=1 Tax=Endozoicomonas sp. ONNA1 TaxID=2828740 RepID=UPI0021487A68|nr:hypothetical protein [Endozoicomonas sp. ONNA1]
MYQLIKGIARINKQWVDLDNTHYGTSLFVLMQSYVDIRLTLKHSITDEQGELYLDDIEDQIRGRTLTIPEFLSYNGDRSLPLRDSITDTGIKGKLTQYDAFEAGWNCLPTNHGVHPDVHVINSEANDLLLTRDDTDYAQRYEYILVAVNGLVYPTLLTEYGIYVLGACNRQSYYQDTEVTIIDFTNVGKIKCWPIKQEDIIYPNTQRQPLRESIYFKLAENISDRTLFMVANGYLNITGNVLEQTDVDIVKLDTRKMPVLEHYQQTKNRFAYEGIDVEHPLSEGINTNRLYDDQNLSAFFTNPNCFFITLENTNVFIQSQHLQATELPGVWEIHEQPEGVLQGMWGDIMNFIVFLHTDQLFIETSAQPLSSLHHNTTDWKNKVWATVNRETAARVFHQRPRFTQLLANKE